MKPAFLLGPTASGKTALSLEVAAKLEAEIVCMDSMQLYRDLPITTAQPSSEARTQIPHHLFEVLDLGQSFDVREYRDRAVAVVEELARRQKRALFVGGTSLYFQALIEGLHDLPAADASFRESFQARLRSQGEEAVFAELEQVDPETAARIGPRDHRRIERALEVFHLTGESLSVHHRKPRQAPFEASPAVVLQPARDWVRERVERRHQAMQDEGLLDELAQVFRKFPELSGTSAQAIGIKEVWQAWQGEPEGWSDQLSSALERMRFHTQRLVRRQCTWARKFTERGLARTLDPSQGSLQELVEAALDVFSEE